MKKAEICALEGQAHSSQPFPNVSQPVDRVGKIAMTDFARCYLHPQIPVVLANATDGWAALRKWTPSFFRHELRSRNVILRRGSRSFKSTLGEYLDYAVKFDDLSSQLSEVEPFYLRNVSVGRHFAEILDDFQVSGYFLPNWLERWPLRKLFPLAQSSSAELFIGPPGARVRFVHRDKFATHSWLSQLYGEKAFWLVSPEQDHLMYQSKEDPDLSMLNSMRAPDLATFPLFAKAKLLACVLSPGETIFIPAGWWHAAESLTLSISLSGNFVNGSNFKDFASTTVLPALTRFKTAGSYLNSVIMKLHGTAFGLMDKMSS